MSHKEGVRTKRHDDRIRRARNFFLITVSLYVAFELYRTGAIAVWILAATPHILPGSLIAGMGFTSLFTVAPASIVLIEIARFSSPLLVASIGAVGAVLGDLFLFMFVRGSVADGATKLMTKPIRRRVRYLLHHRLLHWVLPITGAIIIASPLPDELGLALMGFSRMRIAVFVPISFVMNFFGILAVTLIGQTVL